MAVAAEVLQQRRVAAAEPAPLRREPAVESGVAIDLEAVEELALEEGAERPQSIGRQRLDALLRGAATSIGIDETIREIEPDAVPGRIDPAPTRPVEDAPELAQAPAQLAARIVGHVPEQLAQADYAARPARQARDRPRARAPCANPAVPRPTRPGVGSPWRRAIAHAARTRRAPGPIDPFPLAFPRGLPHSPPRKAATAGSTGNGAYPASDPAPRKAGVNDSHRQHERRTHHDHFRRRQQIRQPDQIDLKAVKTRQQGAWSSGDYGVVGTTLQIVGEELCEALDIRSGQKVLDVAAGNGNVSLAAARRWCNVISTDYVPALLERAKERAAAERLDIEFMEADAEALPFADASFDVVVSTFGVMFTPDQDRAGGEMLRVCRRGGKIGLANWTPESFIGQLFKTLGKHIPPPAGVKSPSLWGSEARLRELFPAQYAAIATKTKQFVFRYRSPAHWLEVFRNYYGPLHKAFAALPPQQQAALEHDVMELMARFNRSGDKTLVLPSDYLEVVVTTR